MVDFIKSVGEGLTVVAVVALFGAGYGWWRQWWAANKRQRDELEALRQTLGYMVNELNDIRDRQVDARTRAYDQQFEMEKFRQLIQAALIVHPGERLGTSEEGAPE